MLKVFAKYPMQLGNREEIRRNTQKHPINTQKYPSKNTPSNTQKSAETLYQKPQAKTPQAKTLPAWDIQCSKIGVTNPSHNRKRTSNVKTLHIHSVAKFVLNPKKQYNRTNLSCRTCCTKNTIKTILGEYCDSTHYLKAGLRFHSDCGFLKESTV